MQRKENVSQMTQRTDHSGSQFVEYLKKDVEFFLQKNAAVACSIVSLDIDHQGHKNVFQIRGKLNITIPQSGVTKLLGFKFVLPHHYPSTAPLAFLDEPEREEIIDMVDYLDSGNRIMFDYLVSWDREFATTKNAQTYNLMNLLVKVYNLFMQMPPLSIEELFGAQAEAQPAPAEPEPAAGEEWEEIPPELLQQQQKPANGGLGDYRQEEHVRQLEDFDPLADLLGAAQNGVSEEREKVDLAQQKAVWTVNYKHKTDGEKMKKNLSLVEQDLMPNIKQIMDTQATKSKAEIEKNIKKIDAFQQASQEVKNKVRQVTKNNQQIRDQLPDIEKHLTDLKQ